MTDEPKIKVGDSVWLPAHPVGYPAIRKGKVNKVEDGNVFIRGDKWNAETNERDLVLARSERLPGVWATPDVKRAIDKNIDAPEAYPRDHPLVQSLLASRLVHLPTI